MPDDIERTIYKLELDGSAYVDGVDKVTNSTKKLSEAQEAANKEIAALKAQQALYKKEMTSLNDALEANKKEVVELTQKLTDLKNAEKNAATGSKEFKADTDKAAESANKFNIQLDAVNKELGKLKAQQADYAKQLSALNGTIKENEKEIASLKTSLVAATNAVKEQGSATTNTTKANDLAGKKIAELKTQEAAYKKELENVNAVLKANEKETLDLTKRLNELKAAEKGSSAEAKNLQSQLRAIATNTKEFKIEQTALKTNLANTTNAIKLQTKELAATEVATGKATSGFTKAYSGLRSLANLIPGVGIGGLVALISGPLIKALTEWATALKPIEEQQKALSDINKKAIESTSEEVTHLRLLASEYDNVNTSAKRKKEIQDELQKSYPNYFADLDKHADKEKYIAEQVDKVTKALLLQAKVQAAQSLLSEKFSDLLKKQFDPSEAISDLEIAGAAFKNVFSNLGQLGLDLQKTASKNITKAEKEYADFEKFIQDFVNKSNAEISNLGGDPHAHAEKTKGAAKQLVNIYAQELQKLKADIAKLDEKGFSSEATITKAIEEDFKIRGDAFVKAFKNKQLTAPQLSALQGYLKNLQDLTLNAQLKSFREQRQAYLQAINDEITNLQIEESTKRIQTLQDSFERERQTILLETDKTATALQQKRDSRIAAILKDAAKNGLKPEELAPQIAQIKSEYEKLLNDLQVIKNQKLQQLAFDTFEALTEEAKRSLDAENLGISQGSLFRIRQEAALFQQGKISFKEYQQALTEIARNEAQERFVVEKSFLELEIKIRRDKLATDKTLTTAQIKRLQDEIRRLEQQLADAEKGNITGNKTDHTKDKLKNFLDYASAIKDLTDSIISFWQQSNEAEQKALDRSIDLQEKRVDAAQRIAERGNAQYLKQEQDRLTELNLQRENAARKQLGIDAALQASQILVGITGAISKIAAAPFGAETIAEIAIIIGALATGFGIVKSLQGNQPKLYKGTKYLERDGAPAGRDTIPVMAHEGEAVIPADTNKRYNAAVAAIYDQTIPAEELNKFVTTYHKIKPVPQPNYERIGEAAMFHIEQDGRMSIILNEQNKLLKDNNELQQKVLRVLSKSGVNVSLDSHGFAVTQMEIIEQFKRNQKI